VSILEGAIFDYGFELKDKHNISLFGKSIEMKITLDAYSEDDGITAEQEQAYWKVKAFLAGGMAKVEKAILEFYGKMYKEFEGGFTAEKMRKVLREECYIIVKLDGETALLISQDSAPENGLAVVILPNLEVQTQDEWL